MSAYATAVLVIVANGVTPIVDEWVYTGSAIRLQQTGQLHVSLISLAPALLESFYGALAVAIGGPEWETFTVASALLAMAGAVGLFDLTYRGTQSAQLSAVLTGAYLFGPLAFALNTTFMTDGHATSLAIISAALFSRGIDNDRVRLSYTVWGSAVASLAFLSRPAAGLVALAAVFVLWFRGSYQKAMLAASLPAIVVISQMLFDTSQETATSRSILLSRLSAPSTDSLQQIIYAAAIQIGIMCIPLIPVLGIALYQGIERRLVAAAAAVAFLIFATWQLNLVGDWLNPAGIFPLDSATVGVRPAVATTNQLRGLIGLSIAIASVVVALLFGNGQIRRLSAGETGLWAFALGSIGLSAVSISATGGFLLDRYTVALLPAVTLSLALRFKGTGSRIVMVVTTIFLVVTASVTLLMTLDGYKTQNSVFALAEFGIAAGIEMDQLDGGAVWTGLHFGDQITEENITGRGGVTWWRETFAPGLAPRYVIGLDSVEGCLLQDIPIDRYIGPDFSVALVDQQPSCL